MLGLFAKPGNARGGPSAKVAPSSARARFGAVPNGQRVYAVGDIHGRADLLTRLLSQIKTDTRGFAGDIHFIGIGDYTNRGPDSAGVVDLLLNLPAGWHKVFLKGNHEWAMEQFMADPRRADWVSWGGDATLASYGIPLFDTAHRPRPPQAVAAELAHTIKQRNHHTFYNSLKLWHRVGGYGFVHAGVRRGISLEDQLDTDLLFSNDLLTQPHDLPCRIVFGHTHGKSDIPHPLNTPDRLGLDTGAYQTGILTAAVLEGATLRFLQTGGA